MPQIQIFLVPKKVFEQIQRNTKTDKMNESNYVIFLMIRVSKQVQAFFNPDASPPRLSIWEASSLRIVPMLFYLGPSPPTRGHMFLLSVKNLTCVTLVRIHTASMSLWLLTALCTYSPAAPVGAGRVPLCRHCT